MQSEKTTKEGKQEKQRKTFAVYAVWLAKNVLFMGLALLLVKYTLTKQPAYRWVYSSLLKENMATIKKHPELTFEEKMKMKREIGNKLYATRFLYPRLLILESELEESRYADRITHVAIVNGEGKDRLPYQVDPEIQHAVLPVVQPKKQ